MNSIRHIIGDCLPDMYQMPDNAFDLAPIDPVYGIDGNFYRRTKDRGVLARLRRKYDETIWKQKPPPDEFWQQLFRVSKNQIVFGANYFPQFGSTHKPPRRHQIAKWIAEHPTGWIVWDKRNSDSTTFNDVELAWTSFDRPTYVFEFMWNGMMQGKSDTEGRRMNGRKYQNEKRIHPTQKPEFLYRHILKNYSEPGEIILDCFCGSGTLLRAASFLGQLDVTAYEIVPAYGWDARNTLIDYLNKSPVFKPNIRLYYDYQPFPVHIRTEPELRRQALLPAFSNALRPHC